MKRLIMVSVVIKYVIYVIYILDNLRSEDLVVILDDMVYGVSGKNYEMIIDRKEVIYYVIVKVKVDDIIIIVGKGYEMY